MVAMGAIQTAKEMMVGEVALTYKYKYNTDGMQVDATWDIQPLVAASPTMWVGIFKEGAALTEVGCVYAVACASLVAGRHLRRWLHVLWW